MAQTLELLKMVPAALVFPKRNFLEPPNFQPAKST